MASRARAKGNYHENWFIKLFKTWKIKAKKQPLSGSLGGEYRGDIVLTINGIELITEVKYRKGTLPSPFTLLDRKDAAIYKRGNGTDPKRVLILPDHVVEKIWRSK